MDHHVLQTQDPVEQAQLFSQQMATRKFNWKEKFHQKRFNLRSRTSHHSNNLRIHYWEHGTVFAKPYDSQSTVGILTLKWEDTPYRGVVSDIKNAIKALEGNVIHVAILQTPVHSKIKQNEIAD